MKGFLARLGGRPRSEIDAEVEALKHPDADRRTAAAEALAERGETAVGPLLAALDDRHPGVRAGAAYALGKIGDRRAVEPLLDLLTDENEHVRGVVVPALGRLGDRRAAGPLARALGDSQPSVRAQAARVLAELDDPEAIPALIAALDDGDREVRLQVAGALAKIGDTRAVEPLIGRLTAREDYFRVQLVAVIGLGDLRDPRAIPPLVRVLEVGDGNFRSAAAEALGKFGQSQFGNVDTVAPLVAVLHDSDPFVRRMAARALGQIHDPRALAPLRAIVADGDADVRSEAEAALQQLAARGIAPAPSSKAPPDRGPETEASEITPVGEFTKGGNTYREFEGPDAAGARSFLSGIKVRRPREYVTVRTPEGIWGKDREGLYLVRLLPWQSELGRAECEGSLVEPPSAAIVRAAMALRAADNYVATVACGRCGREWADGLSPLQPTVVRCPSCGAYNRIESVVRTAGTG